MQRPLPNAPALLFSQLPISKTSRYWSDILEKLISTPTFSRNPKIFNIDSIFWRNYVHSSIFEKPKSKIKKEVVHTGEQNLTIPPTPTRLLGGEVVVGTLSTFYLPAHWQTCLTSPTDGAAQVCLCNVSWDELKEKIPNLFWALPLRAFGQISQSHSNPFFTIQRIGVIWNQVVLVSLGNMCT